MLSLQITPKAEQDLSEIFEYTFHKWGIIQAEKYQDELFNSMQLILENKEIGKAYPYFKREYRKLHINRHLIFYKIESKNCIIVRILHDSVDIRKQLKTK